MKIFDRPDQREVAALETVTMPLITFGDVYSSEEDKAMDVLILGGVDVAKDI